MEALYSHIRATLVDSVTCLEGVHGDGVISALEMCELLGFMISWTVLCLNRLLVQFVFLFNSASRQHCDVWASKFPFLHNIYHTGPGSEACLYCHISWSWYRLGNNPHLDCPSPQPV